MIDTVFRAFRGTVRSPARTGLIVLLLAVGLAFALTALALAFAANDELDKIKQTTGVEAAVSINPRQFQEAIEAEIARVASTGDAFNSDNVGAAVQPLTEADADTIAALPYIRRIETFTLTAVEYSLPGRDRTRENTLQTPLGPVFLPDAILTGARDSAFLTDFQTGGKVLEEGRLFVPEDDGTRVVVLDRATAATEGLAVGDTIEMRFRVPLAEGQEPEDQVVREVEGEIIGIYADLEGTAEQAIAAGQIEAWYAPISLIRELQEEGSTSLSGISIIYDSVDSVEALKTDFEESFDTRLYSLTTTEERFENISGPVQTMRNTSLLVMIGGLAVVGLIMMLLMALVIRGRMREIGILKAIGARNRQVISQFAIETIGVSVVAVLIAVPAVLALNVFLPDVLRPSAEVPAETAGTGFGGGPDLGAGGRALTQAPVIDDPVRTEEVEAILADINATLGADMIAIAAVIAVALGLLGALVPIIAVLRLRPAEVLRLEA